MYCPKHPNQKMTQLFTSNVCDLCNPPEVEITDRGFININSVRNPQQLPDIDVDLKVEALNPEMRFVDFNDQRPKLPPSPSVNMPAVKFEGLKPGTQHWTKPARHRLFQLALMVPDLFRSKIGLNETRYLHVHESGLGFEVAGSTGTGKTTLLARLALEAVNFGLKACLVTIGQLEPTARQLLAGTGDLIDPVAVLEWAGLDTLQWAAKTFREQRDPAVLLVDDLNGIFTPRLNHDGPIERQVPFLTARDIVDDLFHELTPRHLVVVTKRVRAGW